MEDSLNAKMEKLRKTVEKYEDMGYDKTYEEEWKKILNDLNEMKLEIYKTGVFSENEEFKDIKTEDVKFLLISYYQGEMIGKFNENRESVLSFALKFYDEFYKLLNRYEYLTKERKEFYKRLTSKDEDENEKKKLSFDEMVKERENKIQNFKYKKALSEKLKKIEKEKSYDDNREYWTSYLELCWLKMIENIKSITMEIDSLKFIKEQKKTGEYEKQLEIEKQKVKNAKMEYIQIKSPEDLLKLDPNNKLLKNLDISLKPNCDHQACNDFQNAKMITSINDHIDQKLHIRDNVFRASNLPTMTLDEFAQKEMERMDEQKRLEEEAKQNKENSDSDDESVADRKTYKAREWDDWKDANEKGAGNKRR